MLRLLRNCTPIALRALPSVGGKLGDEKQKKLVLICFELT